MNPYGYPVPCQRCGITIYRRHVNSKVPKQCPKCREQQRKEFMEKVGASRRARVRR